MHYQEDRSWRGWLADRRVRAIGAMVIAVALVAAVMVWGGPWDNDPGVAASARSADDTTTSEPSTTSTTSTTVAPTTTVPPTTAAPPSTEPVPPPPPTTVAPARAPASAASASGTGALCVGDSIMLGASSQYFGTLSMCGEVDAKVGRQLSEGISVVASHAPYPATVVIGLGTNGPVTAGEVDSILQLVSNVPKVVLVTVQLNGTRSWQDSVNAELRAAAGRWANVSIADWYGASQGHPEYFRDDRIHITSSGAQAYAASIAAAL